VSCHARPRGPYRALLVAAVAAILTLAPAGGAFSSDTVIATIPVGMQPFAVAVNPVTHRTYVVNYNGSSVSVIDGASDTVTATVALPGAFAAPVAVVVDSLQDPARAFIASFWTGTISMIDESSNVVSATVAPDPVHATGPRSLALDPTASPPKLYTANYGSSSVSVLDARDLSIIKRIATGTHPRALAIFSSANRHRVYAADRYANTVTVIDGDTDTIVTVLSVGQAPKAIAVDPNTGYAYVTCENSDNVYVIDDTDAVAAVVAVGDRPVGVAVDAVAGRVFVANNYSGSVSVIDTATASVTDTVTVGASPYALTWDAGDSKAYVTNYNGSSVSIISDTLDVTTVSVGLNPYAVAVNESLVPHKAYVTNYNSNTVSVIDEPAVAAAETAVSALVGAETSDPVAVSIDPFPDDVTPDLLPVLQGSAEDVRAPYVSNVAAVFVRFDAEARWERAEITDGAGTPSVRWRATSPEPLDLGPHNVQVAAVDQAGAVVATSDFGTGYTSGAFGGRASYSFEVGTLDREAPFTANVEVAPNPVPVGAPFLLTALADDGLSGGSDISSAEYSVDGGPWVRMEAADGAFDAAVETVVAVVPAMDDRGRHDVAVRATDAAGNTGAPATAKFAVSSKK